MRNSSFYTSPSLPHQVHESPRTSGLDNDNNQSQDQRTTSEDHQEMDSEPQGEADKTFLLGNIRFVENDMLWHILHQTALVSALWSPKIGLR